MQLKQPKMSLPGVQQQKGVDPSQAGPAPVVPPAPGGQLFQPMAAVPPQMMATAQKKPQYQGQGGQGIESLIQMIQKVMGGGF